VSAYALTTDYAAHFVRRARCSRTFQGVPFSADTAERSSLARPLKYPWSMARTLFDDSTARKSDERIAPRPRRVAIVPVRLIEGERDQLSDVARDLGLSVSANMRQVVLSRPLPARRAVRPIPEVNRETYHALGRLAADLNAMARRYRLDHVAVRGSGLGRTYSFEGVQRELGVRYHASRDLPELQRAARATHGREPPWSRGHGLASRLAGRLGRRVSSRMPGVREVRTLASLARDLKQLTKSPFRAALNLALRALPPQARVGLLIARTLMNLSRTR